MLLTFPSDIRILAGGNDVDSCHTVVVDRTGSTVSLTIRLISGQDEIGERAVLSRNNQLS